MQSRPQLRIIDRRMLMKEWIEKRMVENMTENVIQLPNWAEYYNNLLNFNIAIKEYKEINKELNAVFKENKKEVGRSLDSPITGR